MFRRLLLAWALLAAAFEPASARTLALTGATLVDLGGFGRSGHDLRDAVVIVRDGRIAAVGPWRRVAIPRGARVIDLRGRWLVPGLIDGFSAQLDTGYAYANLAMGVTTIAQTRDRDPRRGAYVAASPQPNLRRLGSVIGYDVGGLPGGASSYGAARVQGRRLDRAGIENEIAGQAAAGVSGVMLMYPLDDEQVRAAAAYARGHGLFTIGELGHASYALAAAAGVDAFIHSSRLEGELAPRELREKLADSATEGPGDPLVARYGRFLETLDTRSSAFRAFAAALAGHGTFLLPTLTIDTTYLDDTPNPWSSPVGPLIDPRTVTYLPFDRTTGRPALPPGAPADYVAARRQRARKSLEAMRAFHAAGVHFLAGSAAVAFGILPGWGLHRELALLVRCGLTPREALAAASANYAAAWRWRDVGRIVPGYRADLVVLDADPTRDIANAARIERIFLNGEPLDRAALLRWRPSLNPPARAPDRGRAGG